jgi:hypothetical protein
MNLDPEDLAATYAGMGEPELLELARSYDSLTDSTQAVLRAEFARRNLDPPVVEDSHHGPGAAGRWQQIAWRSTRDVSTSK